ncbi:4693_t:CDS:2, partial [Diversispora eburnea]
QISPIFGEITKLAHELVTLYDTAIHNKRICCVLYDQVQVVEASVKKLKITRIFTSKKLTSQFDDCMISLNFVIIVDTKLQIEQIEADLKQNFV